MTYLGLVFGVNKLFLYFNLTNMALRLLTS